MLADRQEHKDMTQDMNEQNEVHVRKEIKKMKEAVPTTPELKRIYEKVTIYEHGDFRVCVIEKDDMFEAWLAHKEYGNASLMFGWPKMQPPRPDKSFSLDEFLEVVANSLEEYEALCADKIEDLDL